MYYSKNGFYNNGDSPKLDRKSSRGMIYENEELRLRTININAEIERGQSDIKKLRRENEQLRKEIWCLRDEYDKLDKLLKDKDNSSCTSCSSDTDSCTSCSESEETETTQNLENVQKTTLNNLRTGFDHLSVVTEETSAENSDKNSQNSNVSPAKDNSQQWDALPPDMGYPASFAPQIPLNGSNRSLPFGRIPLNELRAIPQFNQTIDTDEESLPPSTIGQTLSTTQTLHLNGSKTLLPPFSGQYVTPVTPSNRINASRTLPPSINGTGMDQTTPKHFFAPLKTSKSYENCTESENLDLSKSWSNLTSNNSYTPWTNFVADNLDQNSENRQNLQILSTFTSAQSTLPTVVPAKTVLSTNFTNISSVTNSYLKPRSNISPKIDLQTCKKTTPDIVVKTDVAYFSPDETSSNSFVNGGNLDELLQDIDTISKDILQISSQNSVGLDNNLQNIKVPKFQSDPLQEYNQFSPISEKDEQFFDEDESKDSNLERPYKTEINVVLMPKSMPLLGFEKYQNIKSSLESLDTFKKSSESLELDCIQNLSSKIAIPNSTVNSAVLPNVIPKIPNVVSIVPVFGASTTVPQPNLLQNIPPTYGSSNQNCFTPQPNFPNQEDLLGFNPTPNLSPIVPSKHTKLSRQPSNPFFYGSFDSYQNSDAFNNRYNPDYFVNPSVNPSVNQSHDNFGFKNDGLDVSSDEKLDDVNPDKFRIEKADKTKLSSSCTDNKNVDSDREDNSKSELTENEKNDSTSKQDSKSEDQSKKSPKVRRTRKVSIYFKGKKDKLAKSLSLDTKMPNAETLKPVLDKSPLLDRKLFGSIKTVTPINDPKLFKDSKIDPKDVKDLKDPKLPVETDAGFKQQDSLEKKDQKDSDNQKSSDSKTSYDRKHRKSSSTSPERKHVHIQDEAATETSKKCHKKRHRKSERRPQNFNRKNSVSTDKFNREQRSFSVCTDRSNILDHKYGYDDFLTNSERDRSNSLSSCETVKSRKFSQVPQFQVTGKIPWFGCWGNGCL